MHNSNVLAERHGKRYIYVTKIAFSDWLQLSDVLFCSHNRSHLTLRFGGFLFIFFFHDDLVQLVKQGTVV